MKLIINGATVEGTEDDFRKLFGLTTHERSAILKMMRERK
jgi:hypothetical protein